MDIEKTKQYYDQLTEDDLCSCAYCRNYVKEIRAAYPELADYMAKLGADIEKPFEVIPVGPAGGIMFYSGAQYVLMGSAGGFEEASIGEAEIAVTDGHPMTDIKEDHFVIEISPIYLRWNGEE